ncbi:MAG TPA: hypothetical protein VIF15_22440 [Polyangiaceae bacterium]|jgi:hypothetical protein
MIRRPLVSSLLVLALASCGGATTTASSTGDAATAGDDYSGGDAATGGDVAQDEAGEAGGGDSGLEGGDAGGLCHLDPPGSLFTFHVHNGGSATLSLAYGCGGALPIVLPTSQGVLGIGPGPADTCEFTCEEVYAGTAGQSCSDCGPGYGAPLAPGATVDIAWDRRVYTEIHPDTQCVASGQPCAMGMAVPAAAAQKGTITVCTGTSLGSGYCSTSEDVPFTLDTTGSAGTIEVK